MESTSWTPERKIVGGAIAGLAAVVFQLATGIDLPPGTEASAAIVVAYLLPNKKG